MNSALDRFFNRIEQQGWKARIIPVRHLMDLRKAIVDRFEQGLIDEQFYRDQLDFFSFDLPSKFNSAESIIILAVPTPRMRVFFNWKGSRLHVVIPPTYVSYTKRTEKVQSILSEWLQRDGFHLMDAQLPLKTLAVCSGLAKYGRNNICYVEGMGSFLQLVAAFSDLPWEIDPWLEPEMLDRCKSCIACLRNCPTKAISNDRFLLHAELCLTYHNESDNNFPDWINPLWHHCWIGCMRCQTICPENKSVRDWYEDRDEFSEQETTFFIQQVPLEKLPEKTVRKLKSLEINADYRILCRNLSMIIKEPYL